ncbi:MAG: HEAT repeat domain-containing protein [Nitrospira sp.]|nr:HEAT repeat domain-containing protein [Nitrospira sp.]
MFGKLGSDATAAIPLLIQALDDPDVGIRGRSARALSRIGPTAWPRIIEQLTAPSPKVRQASIAVIGAIDASAQDKLPLLGQALKDSDFGVKMQALWGAGLLGPAAVPLLPQITHLLEVGDTDIRLKAIQTLEHIGWKIKDAVPPVGNALHDPELQVRIQAASTLLKMGPNSVLALKDIIEAVGENNASIRNPLIELLGDFQKSAYPAIPHLLKIFLESHSPLQPSGKDGPILKAIGKIDGSAIESFRRLASENNKRQRLYALVALDKLGELGEKTQPSQNDLVNELILALNDFDSELIQLIPRKYYFLIPDQNWINQFITGTSHPNKEVRLGSITFLKTLSIHSAPAHWNEVLATLQHLAENDPDEEIRRAASGNTSLPATTSSPTKTDHQLNLLPVCQFMRPLISAKAHLFENPNYASHPAFSKWLRWEWKKKLQGAPNFPSYDPPTWATEVDLDNDDTQDIMILKTYHRHSMPYMNTYLFSGKDLTPYFIAHHELRDLSRPLFSLNTAGLGASKLRFISDRDAFDCQTCSAVSEKILPFSYQGQQFLLFGHGEQMDPPLLIGQMELNGEITPLCDFTAKPSSKKSKKK